LRQTDAATCSRKGSDGVIAVHHMSGRPERRTRNGIVVTAEVDRASVDGSPRATAVGKRPTHCCKPARDWNVCPVCRSYDERATITLIVGLSCGLVGSPGVSPPTGRGSNTKRTHVALRIMDDDPPLLNR